MKKLSFFLMAMLFTCATTLQAAEVTETIAMKGFGGLTTASYENVTKTGTSDKGTEMVAYAFNPSTGQIRGNKTAIAGASVTSADKNKNWSLYNTQAMPGAIKKITVTQTATGTNMFKGNLYVALGTTNQGDVTTVTGAQKNTTGTATEFTFDIDETQGYTYFKLLSNVAFTGGSVAGVVVTVTYAEAASNPDAVKYTVTAKVNDPAMGTVSGAGEYEEGKTATLTANANAGYKFVNWSNGSTENPLKITVTEDVEITANFEVIPTMTCTEASAAASGATVVLNPFDVVYVVKGAGYIYIKDESGVALIYDFNLDDQLKAGDHVEGFVGVSSPYNGLPEIKPTVSFADLKVTPGTAPEATVFETVPTKEDVNKYVVFKGVKLTSNISYTTGSASNATISVGGKNVTLRNQFKLAASLTSGSTYDIYAFVAVYNSSLQMYYASSVDVSPERTITATVNPAETGTVTGAGTYKEGKTATLKATPAEGYAFTCWTEGEDTVSTAANYSFKVAADRALVANFAQKTYNVTVTAENGTVTGAGEYIENAEVTLTATAAEGYEFTCWTSGEDTVSTENPYTFVVTADLALVANFKEVVVEPTTETVYFIDVKKWGKVNAYAWNTNGDNSWPGKPATKEAEQIAGYDVYSFTADAGEYDNVIFNNKVGDTGSQTDDLVWTAGKYYWMGVAKNFAGATKEEAEATLAAPLPEVWNIVGAAGLMGKDWDLNAAENAMTKQEDGTYKLEKKDITLTAGTYEYKAAKDHDWAVSVPSGQTNQTLTISKSGIYDVTFVLDVTAKKLTATATLKKEAVVIPTIVIAGDMNGWNQTQDKFTMASDSLTATFKATLTAKSYGFKMIVGGAWHSDAKTITRAANSTKFTGANGGNSTLKADIAGEYLFTWEYATKTLTVTYPELVTTITATFDLTQEKDTRNVGGTYNIYAGDYTLRIYGYNGAGTYQDDPTTEEDAAPMLFTPDYEDPLDAVVVVTIDEENNKEVMQVTATSADGKKIYNLTINIALPSYETYSLVATNIKAENGVMEDLPFISLKGEGYLNGEEAVPFEFMVYESMMGYGAEGTIGEIYVYSTVAEFFAEEGGFYFTATMQDEEGKYLFKVEMMGTMPKAEVEIVVKETKDVTLYNLNLDVQGNMAMVDAANMTLSFNLTLLDTENYYGNYTNDAFSNIWYGDDKLYAAYGEAQVYAEVDGKAKFVVSFISTPDAEGNVTLYNFTLYAGDQPVDSKHTVTILVTPEGAGTVTGAGEYEDGAEVTVTAEANEGYIFLGWMEDGEFVANDYEYKFQVLEDVTLIAYYLPYLEGESNDLVIGENTLTASAELSIGKLNMNLVLGEEEDGMYLLAETSTLSIAGNEATLLEGMAAVNREVQKAGASMLVMYNEALYYISVLMVAPETGVDNIQVENVAVKMIKNGQLIIIKNGVEYNVQGAILK